MYYQRPLVFRVIESLCRHWRLFAFTSLAIVALITVYVLTRPKEYNTQFTVVLNGDSIQNPLSNQADVVGWDVVQETINHFQTLVETKEFVQAALTGPTGAPVPLDRPIDFNNQEQVVALQKSINTWGVGDDAFAVGMTYSDPQDSVTILQALIHLFIERNAQEKSSFYTEQAAFISQQVDQYRDKLTRSEAALSEFKSENVGHLPSQQDAIEQQLVNLNQQIQQYQINLAEDKSRETVLAQQIAQTPKTIVASQTSGDSPLDTRIKALQVELDEDVTVRNMRPNHPEVISLEKAIHALTAQRNKQLADHASDASGVSSTDVEQNPEYVYLANELSNLKIDDQGLQTQIQDTQALIQQTQVGVAKVPEEDRILANLQRDYSFDSDQYGLLYKRLQDAIVSEQIYLRQQRGMYNLYETSPPQSSTSKSKTAMLFAGGIVLALLIAAALVILSEAMDRSFRDPYEMQRILGVPVLAMLPESADLHVADSRHPQLPGGRQNKRLSRSSGSPLLPGPTPLQTGAAVAAAADSAEQHTGNFDKPGFGVEPAPGAGGAG